MTIYIRFFISFYHSITLFTPKSNQSKVMVSKSGLSASKFRKSHWEQGSDNMTNLNCKFTQLKRQIQAERVVSVGEKLENNSKRVQSYVSDLEKLASSRNDLTVTRTNSSENFLSFRMDNPIYIYVENNGFVDRDYFNREEVPYSTTAKFPLVERMPPFTTWIFLDRNQRMIDDQSVAGRRQIYYEKHGGEALVCSDSEEDHGELTLPKHEFSEGEDRIIRVAFQECGVGDEVINTLTQFVRGTSTEIQERFNMLEEKDKMIDTTCVQEGSEDNVILNKSLSAALDSFDNLFCRRCLVFDCRLHGCSQNLIYPIEKHSNVFDLEDERKPCGDQCYLWFNGLKDLIKRSAVPLDGSQRKVSDDEEQESKRKNEIVDPTDSVMMSSMVVLDDFHKHNVDTLDCPLDVSADKVRDKGKDIAEIPLENRVESSRRSEWKPLEKDLYLKGLEIFGRNSCLIARSLLSGLKTCKEVSSYMYGDGAAMVHGSSAILRSFFEDIGKSDMGFMEADMGVKSRVCRKRGRARKVKSSWKSAGHPSLWRRIIDGKDEPYKQFSPCNCEPVCGKQCPCQLNGTCCEKYCGCSKGCKNRFRGCHCAKSQCKSRQCPCFAARRECDPDVCRNCWISCGDGSLGEPPRRGEGQCGNMRLLLRQQQRILLAKSDVAGWGAFIKNSVNKNDYLGEYTGELISHQEADKRGKIYDRTNSSFLFDLNDQYVLDAYRKGDKLKFANHSPTPNCYAKVMLVAGDHRVGIFANERIEGGEELFYDYRYGPDQAPAWARKPESGSKRDSSLQHQGRAKKHQSG